VAAEGWDALRRGAIYHPVDLLGYRELAQALKKTVSEASYENVKRLMSGPDKVHYDRNMFYGEACQAHACGGDTDIFIVIDFVARRIVVAMKDSDKAPVIIPAEADWPPAAKEELARRSWQGGVGKPAEQAAQVEALRRVRSKASQLHL
jgi:hypothetical protein